LLHVKRMLSSFEYVTTNGFGSHIAYAAFCGAKVSIFGPFAEWPPARPTYATKMYPEVAELLVEVQSEKALRTRYPFLFVNPHDAEVRQEWGATELGDDNRRSPHGLRALFGWPENRVAPASHHAEGPAWSGQPAAADAE
jgi:hypothetical protein